MFSLRARTSSGGNLRPVVTALLAVAALTLGAPAVATASPAVSANAAGAVSSDDPPIVMGDMNGYPLATCGPEQDGAQVRTIVDGDEVPWTWEIVDEIFSDPFWAWKTIQLA